MAKETPEEEKFKDMSVEEIFDELDATLKKLESSDTPLEESFEQYEMGMKLVKACSEKIDKVEKQMIVLQKETEGDGEQ